MVINTGVSIDDFSIHIIRAIDVCTSFSNNDFIDIVYCTVFKISVLRATDIMNSSR